MIKLLRVTPLPNFLLHLEYDDGTSGDVNVTHLTGRGVFKELADPTFFQSVSVGAHGQVRWNDDLELCADSLYLQLTGKSVQDLFRNPRAHADA